MNAYTFHISLYDLAFLGTIFIGLTIAAFLWFTKKNNQTANRFLALATVTIVLWIARILGNDIGLSTYAPNWSRWLFQFSLALGPLIYFYVLKITRPEYKFRLNDLLHFSPLLPELGIQALEVRDSIKTGAATYATLASQQLSSILHLLAFISVSIYLYQSHKLIGRFYRRLKFNGGDRYRRELQWLQNLIMGFGLLWLLWIPFKAIDYFYYHNRLGINSYYPLYLVLAAMGIWIVVVAFSKSQIGVPADVPSFLKPSIPSELKDKGVWLKKVVKTNRYYQDPELSLNSLAEKLKLTTHELSAIINTALKKSFNDFVNEYRVADVARKMQDPAFDHLTLQGIAYDSGFNSPRTFHRAFKQLTGKTPAEYKKQLPSYNLAYRSQPAAVISNQINRNYMFQ